MRRAFIEALVGLAEHDDRIWLLYGDLGFGVVDEFAERFPARCINAGVAEQNMMGVAAGLALTGKIVFVYSITNFVTLRCLEQVRNDVCYHQANVKIVGVGVGLDYAPAGFTHYGLEDGDIVALLPNMTVKTPANREEVRRLVREVAEQDGPFYLRLHRQEPSTICAKGETSAAH